MSSKETIRNVHGSDTAILFIHGILGTPDHFTPFLPLVPSNWSIYNMVLKGHCGSVRDFSAASMAEWKEQVHGVLKKLMETNERVIIAAHSMGTLFAIREAVENPVTELFLMNVPLKIRVRSRVFKTSWRIFHGDIKPDDEWTLAAKMAYGTERDTHIFRYLGWVPRYLELFSEIRKTRKILSELKVKSRVYFSVHDEMVSPKSAKLFEPDLSADVKMLNTSGHYFYSREDGLLLKKDFSEMIEEMSD